MAEILDSGERRTFDSGAVRDIQEGKGRCDLLPLFEIGRFNQDQILVCVEKFRETKDITYIHESITRFLLAAKFEEKGLIWELELAKHYEDGAKKYEERNWQKGIPIHCYVDSGVRHYLKWKAGWTDERHDRAFLWNMFGLLWTMEHMVWLDDYTVSFDSYMNAPEDDDK